jgi:hypothetical protein
MKLIYTNEKRQGKNDYSEIGSLLLSCSDSEGRESKDQGRELQ